MDTQARYQLGPNAVDRFLHDPKRLGFLFARYRFASRILHDCRSIIDIGCGDGLGTAVLLQTKARKIVGVDYDDELIAHANKQLKPALEIARPEDAKRLSFKQGDFFDLYISGMHGVICMDVIEHILPQQADEFVGSIYDSLNEHGIAVIGTPNGLAEEYASDHSRVGHINMYEPEELKAQMRKYFRTVIMCGMNDEMVNFGFEKLVHYVVCIGIK